MGEDAPLKPNKVVGKYELFHKLGKGTFGSVVLGRDKNTGKKYAVKILDKSELMKQSLGQQVNREIAVLLQVAHGNVCTMRECFQTGSHVYLVLEYIEGGELFEYIVKNKRLDEGVARELFQQLIRGLHYCHKNDIAHRDLKPENLMLDANGVLKITDFGLSNTQQHASGGEVGDAQLLRTVCGTPNYVAPEVLTGKGYNGFEADMWSAGVVLYVMVAGKLPFQDKEMQSLFRKIREANYHMPDGFSPELKDLLQKLINPDPKKRFTVKDVVEHQWLKMKGWKSEWLEEGELIRTPSQQEINKAIAQYADRDHRRNSATPKPEEEHSVGAGTIKPGDKMMAEEMRRQLKGPPPSGAGVPAASSPTTDGARPKPRRKSTLTPDD